MKTLWVMWDGALSDEIVSRVISVAGKAEEAVVIGGGTSGRKSRVSWLNDQTWLFDTLFDYANIANQQAFQTSVYKNAPIQYTEYHGSEGGHYGWHHDVDWAQDDGLQRKLSLTVQLSEGDEYEGGDFQFRECDAPDPNLLRRKGTILVFPSYLQHQVTPVTSGVRRSLVSWFEGPFWR